VGQWDPNFKSVVETSHVDGPYPEDEDALAAKVLSKIGVEEDELQAAYFNTDTVFELSLADATVQLDIESGALKTASKEPRFFLRVANWLHYNRGKSAWTYVADGYAVLLLYLAMSGVFMLKGRKGFIGRGAILVGIGAALPIAYVHFASGP